MYWFTQYTCLVCRPWWTLWDLKVIDGDRCSWCSLVLVLSVPVRGVAQASARSPAPSGLIAATSRPIDLAINGPCPFTAVSSKPVSSVSFINLLLPLNYYGNVICSAIGSLLIQLLVWTIHSSSYCIELLLSSFLLILWFNSLKVEMKSLEIGRSNYNNW